MKESNSSMSSASASWNNEKIAKTQLSFQRNASRQCKQVLQIAVKKRSTSRNGQGYQDTCSFLMFFINNHNRKKKKNTPTIHIMLT